MFLLLESVILTLNMAATTTFPFEIWCSRDLSNHLKIIVIKVLDFSQNLKWRYLNGQSLAVNKLKNTSISCQLRSWFEKGISLGMSCQEVAKLHSGYAGFALAVAGRGRYYYSKCIWAPLSKPRLPQAEQVSLSFLFPNRDPFFSFKITLGLRLNVKKRHEALISPQIKKLINRSPVFHNKPRRLWW